ncbi:hypothetical protein [Alkalicoccus urumqiensis]|uniref:Uncharacterized protein n=1 Tax=Alkalicoccus urumqiensis TaxID=1548213 RepID=A0A2P6MIT5_ALKUR|nr:hypothetical protein [Alkalicoccus urumqiensis]PRO66199.1 hypothetical protein C6I21_05185 [Alkalicoccus urumqiensis]
MKDQKLITKEEFKGLRSTVPISIILAFGYILISIGITHIFNYFSEDTLLTGVEALTIGGAVFSAFIGAKLAVDRSIGREKHREEDRKKDEIKHSIEAVINAVDFGFSNLINTTAYGYFLNKRRTNSLHQLKLDPSGIKFKSYYHLNPHIDNYIETLLSNHILNSDEVRILYLYRSLLQQSENLMEDFNPGKVNYFLETVASSGLINVDNGWGRTGNNSKNKNLAFLQKIAEIEEILVYERITKNISIDDDGADFDTFVKRVQIVEINKAYSIDHEVQTSLFEEFSSFVLEDDDYHKIKYSSPPYEFPYEVSYKEDILHFLNACKSDLETFSFDSDKYSIVDRNEVSLSSLLSLEIMEAEEVISYIENWVGKKFNFEDDFYSFKDYLLEEIVKDDQSKKELMGKKMLDIKAKLSKYKQNVYS